MELEHKAYWALKFINFDSALFDEKRKLQIAELEDMHLNVYMFLLNIIRIRQKHSKEVKPYGTIEILDPSTQRSYMVNG